MAITRNNVTVWTVPAIADAPILPTALPGDGEELYAQACRGQTVSLSFCVRTSRAACVEIEVPRGCTYCQPIVDVRYVRCWMQNKGTTAKREMGLVPELLLHDPDLVRVLDGKNVVKTPTVDADTLLPAMLRADWTQQYWVTIRVPYGCEEGMHDLFLYIRANGVHAATVPVSLNVLPFTLEQPCMDFAVYYKGEMKPTFKTEAQYASELSNMAAHGVKSVVTWQDFAVAFGPNGTQQHLDRIDAILRLMRAAGISTDPLFIGRMSIPFATPDTFGAMTERLTKCKTWLAQRGISEVYVLGSDEPTVEKMQAQSVVWAVARKAGVKVFAALSTKAAEALPIVGYILDLALFNAADDTRPFDGIDLAPWHEKGAKVWHYGPSCYERPEYTRRRFGLGAMLAGYDGVCPYVYSEAWGPSIWDDADHARKDHCFVYPTDSGVLDTIQWEGFREAVNDVRYAATLKARGGEVPAIEGRSLDDVRDEMIGLVMAGGL